MKISVKAALLARSVALVGGLAVGISFAFAAAKPDWDAPAGKDFATVSRRFQSFDGRLPGGTEHVPIGRAAVELARPNT